MQSEILALPPLLPMKYFLLFCTLVATVTVAHCQLLGIAYNSATARNEFRSIDPVTGVTTLLNSFTFSSGGFLSATFTCDPATGKAYTISGGSLYSFSLSSGAVLSVAALNASMQVLGPGLAGNLVGIAYNSATARNEFRSIDPVTGVTTLLNSFTFSSGGFLSATFTCDPATGKAYTISGGSLYSFSLSSGAVLSVAALNASMQTMRYSAPRLVVFIPGIAGSVLSLNGVQLWPTIWPGHITTLNLRPPTFGIVASDIARAYKTTHIYDGLVNHFTGTGGQGYTEFILGGDPANMTTGFQAAAQSMSVKPTFFPFPYDWRKSNSTQTATLHEYITNIRQFHGGAKVNIVAHSMGGLLTRRYILDHPEDIPYIDHVVTIGSPFWGAPKAIYNTLDGNFFPFAPVNWLNNSAVIAALPTWPGVSELLPSDHYLQYGGLPVMSEARRDENNQWNVRPYSPLDLKTLLNLKGLPDAPSSSNDFFHNYQGGLQDNWSLSFGSISYFHIVGQKNEEDTVRHVISRVQAVENYDDINGVYVSESHFYEREYGPGDGTVPLLSAQRADPFYTFDHFLAPGTPPPWVIRGVKDVEHVALPNNEKVLEAIDAVLANRPVPPPPTNLMSQALANGMVSKQRITITGVGYVRVADSLGNENTKLNDFVAKSIPNVETTYSASESWVDIVADSTVDLTIQGPATDPPLKDHCDSACRGWHCAFSAPLRCQSSGPYVAEPYLAGQRAFHHRSRGERGHQRQWHV